MTLAPTYGRVVLADRVFPRSLALDVVLVVAGAALTAIAAQINIPMWPVPMTAQTLAVLLVGATLGAVRGGIALTVYALVGIVGLPVFSEYSSGWGIIAGPTGGYIIGFIVSAALVGWLSERAWERKFLKAIATFAAGTVVVFVIGLPWLAIALGNLGAPNDFWSVLNGGFFPFLIGGAVKALIAAGLLPLAWWGAGKIESRRAEASQDDSTA